MAKGTSDALPLLTVLRRRQSTPGYSHTRLPAHHRTWVSERFASCVGRSGCGGFADAWWRGSWKTSNPCRLSSAPLGADKAECMARLSSPLRLLSPYLSPRFPPLYPGHSPGRFLAQLLPFQRCSSHYYLWAWPRVGRPRCYPSTPASVTRSMRAGFLAMSKATARSRTKTQTQALTTLVGASTEEKCWVCHVNQRVKGCTNDWGHWAPK